MSNASNRPKYREILQTLLREIENGRYRAGERLPADQEFASRFAVSRPTITKAVQEIERMGLVQRRAGSGTYLNKSAAEPRLVFGQLVPDLGDSEIFEPICSQIARTLQSRGHFLQWAGGGAHVPSRENVESADYACERFIEEGVCGVFFVPFVTPPGVPNPNERILAKLRKRRIPVILLDRDIVPFPFRSDFDLVGIDHFRGQGRLAAELISLDYRRIHMWVWQNVANTIQLRIAGVRQVMASQLGKCDEDWIHVCDPSDPAQVSQLWETHKPDAIMCANDVFAAYLLKTLDKLNIQVPEELAVAGYDDVRYANLLRVSLSTVSQPCREIGDAAVEAMMFRINHPTAPPQEVLLTPQLTLRDSTQKQSDVKLTALDPG
ncbi:MAG: substrate-binding domain-containing protein [Blastopirellula sp. JB062]